MMAVADQLQLRFGIAINYEDPPFQHKERTTSVISPIKSRALASERPIRMYESSSQEEDRYRFRPFPFVLGSLRTPLVRWKI